MPSTAKELVLNQSYDVAWAAYGRCNGFWKLLPHESANGYANGFPLAACNSVVLLNWAQGAFIAGTCFAAIALCATVLFAFLTYRVYVGRRAGMA